LATCKIIIKDEVNCKIEGLDLDTRKALTKKFKYEDPTARFRPSYKLGRWDGAVSFFGLGGTTYMYMLGAVLEYLESKNYYVEVEDLRTSLPLEFEKVSADFWGDQTWPKGHLYAGEKIRLRDDQVEVVNIFLENPQCIQEIATGFGKTITTATLSKICEKYGRTITIVPNKSLVDQTEEDFINCQLDVGVYYGDRKDIGKTHTICTWQSLNLIEKYFQDSKSTMSLADFFEGANTVMVDECFDGDSKVLTPIGYIPIKDIKIGDTVINYSENTGKFKVDIVENLHKNLTNSASEKMYELVFDNNTVINVTGNHKFLTQYGWIRADLLTNEHTIINKT
jgi:hypothetical protein